MLLEDFFDFHFFLEELLCFLGRNVNKLKFYKETC